MARRWIKTLVMVAFALFSVIAVNARGVNGEADCLKDGESCVGSDCAPVCCSGAQIRIESAGRHCPSLPPDFFSTPSPVDGSNRSGAGPTSSSSASVASDPSASSGWVPTDDIPADTATQAPAPAAALSTDTPAPPPSTQATESVDSLQSTTSLAGSRQGMDGATTAFVVVGAMAGCVVLVAAVMYKKKTTNSLEIPGSSYHGSADAGLTPDNRSLVEMLDGGCRATTDSMKQVPVLSMGSRQDATIARLSSPFGQGGVRISSPAHRGGSNEDFAFAVDTGSNRVDASFVDTELGHVVEKDGVVAL